MYGDTDVTRRRVGALREQAAGVRALADRLVARTEAVAWDGRAAETLRTRIQERAAHLRRTADRHEVAADALERHAAEVARRKEAIAVAELTFARVVADGEQPAGFDPPPPGHKGWLAVEVPRPRGSA